MEDAIAVIADWLGVDPAVIVALLPTLVFIFNLIYRSIPDDKVGFLGVVRNITKVLGLYLSNRVASGVSVNTVVKSTLDSVPSVARDVAEEAVDRATTSQLERDGRGRFVSKS